MEPDKHVALSPMTVSQPQCSTVHGLATFSNVNQCEKNDRERPRTFCCFRSYQKAQPCLKANRSRAPNGQEPAQGTKQVVRWQEKAAEEAEGSSEQNR